MEQTLTLHIVGGNSRSRAEQARLAFELGYHAEVYSDVSELLDRPLKTGVIIASGEALANGTQQLIDSLGEVGIWLPVVAASENPSVESVVEAIRGGALYYLATPLEEDEFARMVAHIEQEAGRHANARRKLVEARHRIGRLSKREREVLDWLSEGCSNKEIARALSISPRTVEIHRANMMDKLGANHAAEAVRLQMESRLVSTAQVQLPELEDGIMGRNWQEGAQIAAPMERSAFV